MSCPVKNRPVQSDKGSYGTQTKGVYLYPSLYLWLANGYKYGKCHIWSVWSICKPRCNAVYPTTVLLETNAQIKPQRHWNVVYVLFPFIETMGGIFIFGKNVWKNSYVNHFFTTLGQYQTSIHLSNSLFIFGIIQTKKHQTLSLFIANSSHFTYMRFHQSLDSYKQGCTMNGG